VSSARDPRTQALATAHQALARGAWEEARTGFEAALALQETPEALEGLGLATWWLDDGRAVFAAREQAYRLYHARGDRRGAGRVALSLAEDALYFRGQPAVARGWLGRARELLESPVTLPEQGWLHIVSGDLALIIDGDMAEARRRAERASEVAREIGDEDLVMVARALEGVSRVGQGDTGEGMTRLDEVATAALHGEIANPLAIGICCCYLMIACERSRDLDRAAQWCDEIQRFCETWRCNGVLALCRAQYAGVLLSRGLWDEAERELEYAVPKLAATRPALAPEGIVRLAALRRRQGRLDETEALLREIEGHPAARLERAALALARGSAAEAARGAERFLLDAPQDASAERAEALELLVRAFVAQGQPDRAAETVARDAEAPSSGPAAALRRAARGVLAATQGEHADAVRHLAWAVEDLATSGARFDAARLRIDLARSLHHAGEVEGAAREARAALEALRALGAHLEADRAAAVLQEIEPASDAGTPDGLTAREVEVLRLVAEGRSNHEIARRLFVSDHTIKRHVANILGKLDLPSRAAAAAYAARRNLL
jgi:DNA-binding CsgD family transcriptional regulator